MNHYYFQGRFHGDIESDFRRQEAPIRSGGTLWVALDGKLSESQERRIARRVQTGSPAARRISLATARKFFGEGEIQDKISMETMNREIG